MSSQQNTEQNHSVKIGNEPFEYLATFKHLATTPRTQRNS